MEFFEANLSATCLSRTVVTLDFKDPVERLEVSKYKLNLEFVSSHYLDENGGRLEDQWTEITGLLPIVWT